MRNLLLIIFCGTAVIIQVSSAGVFFGPDEVPNLVLVLTISLILIMGFEKSLIWIIFTGILSDVYIGWAIGTSAIILVLIAWAISGLQSVANIKSRRLLFFPALFFLSACFAIIYDLLAGMAGRAASLWLGANYSIFGVDYFSWSYALKVFWTALSIYAVYYFTAKINAAFSRPVPSFIKK